MCDGPIIPVELPVLLKQQTFGQRAEGKQGRGQRFASFACQLTHTSLVCEPEVPENGLVDVTESLISTLARYPPKRIPGQQPIGAARKRATDDSNEESDKSPPAQGPTAPPGGDDEDPSHDDGDDNKEEEEEKEDSSSDSEMDKGHIGVPKDPDNEERASSICHRPREARIWRRCSTNFATSPSMMLTPS